MYDRFYYDHSTPLQGCGRSFMDFRHVHSTRSASQLLGLNTFSRRTCTTITFVFMPNLTPNRKARTKICIEIHSYTYTFSSDTHTDRHTILRYNIGEITISSKMIHVFQYHTMTYYIILCTFTI